MYTIETPEVSLTNKMYCQFCPSYCCYKLKGSLLLITAVDINRIARHFNISDGEIRKRYIQGKNTLKNKEDSSCIFLIDGVLHKRCSIHKARPQQCMDFPYDKACPYLIRQDLLEQIFPKVESSRIQKV